MHRHVQCFQEYNQRRRWSAPFGTRGRRAAALVLRQAQRLRGNMGAAGLGHIVFDADEGKGPIAVLFRRTQAKIRQGWRWGGDVRFSSRPISAVAASWRARHALRDRRGPRPRRQDRFCFADRRFPCMSGMRGEQDRFSHNHSMPNMAIEEFSRSTLGSRENSFHQGSNTTRLQWCGASGAIRNYPGRDAQGIAIAGYGEMAEQKFGGMRTRFPRRSSARHCAGHRPYRDVAVRRELRQGRALPDEPAC